MRLLLALVVLLTGPICWAGIPALHLGRPLPNGCIIHALLYMAGLDPVVGTAEMVKVVGGGGVPHVIAVVSKPDGTRYGRDEEVGVFALGRLTPQAAYNRARQEAIGTKGLSGGVNVVGELESARSLRVAFEKLHAAGFQPERVRDVIVWRIGAIAYVYSPSRGCAEIRTCSRDFFRIAAAALNYWTGRV